MPQYLAAVTLLVPDYDEAIAYYVGVLGFDLIEDTPRGPGKRWVVVAPAAAAVTTAGGRTDDGVSPVVHSRSNDRGVIDVRHTTTTTASASSSASSGSAASAAAASSTTVAPRTGFVLARAATPEQAAAVGKQAGGRVAFFLHTDDFWRDYARYVAAGVTFAETPRRESYATVAVFADRYGNRWDLLGPAT